MQNSNASPPLTPFTAKGESVSRSSVRLRSLGCGPERRLWLLVVVCVYFGLMDGIVFAGLQFVWVAGFNGC